MGTESVKYLLPDYPDDVLFAVENDKVLKVVFEDGKEKFFFTEMQNPVPALKAPLGLSGSGSGTCLNSD